jgi:hypothetical protein
MTQSQFSRKNLPRFTFCTLGVVFEHISEKDTIRAILLSYESFAEVDSRSSESYSIIITYGIHEVFILVSSSQHLYCTNFNVFQAFL